MNCKCPCTCLKGFINKIFIKTVQLRDAVEDQKEYDIVYGKARDLIRNIELMTNLYSEICYEEEK